MIERIWCLSPDRLARVYAYQVIVLDELARHRVQVAFADAPAIDDDPQAKLLTQVQGVIAEFSVISTRRDAGLPDVRVAA